MAKAPAKVLAATAMAGPPPKAPGMPNHSEVALNSILENVERRLHALEQGVGGSWNIHEIQELILQIQRREHYPRDSTVNHTSITDRKGFEGLPKWTGCSSGVNFDVWRFEVMNFLTTTNPKYKVLLQWLETTKENVDDESATGKAMDFNIPVDEYQMRPGSLGHMAEQVYALLARKTGETPQSLVRVLEDPADGTELYLRGLLAWQSVYRDAMGWNTAKKRALNEAVTNPTRLKNTDDVPKALGEWELKRRDWVKQVNDGHPMGATQEMAILQAMVPTTLENMIESNFDTLTTPTIMRKYILDHCFRNKKNETEVKDHELHELDGDHDCKQPEGGEGGLFPFYDGKGGSKGGKAERFDGYCDFCGGYGHKKSQCRKLDAYMQNKGGKGYGKDSGKSYSRYSEQSKSIGKGLENKGNGFGKGGYGKNNFYGKGSSNLFGGGKGGWRGLNQILNLGGSIGHENQWHQVPGQWECAQPSNLLNVSKNKDPVRAWESPNSFHGLEVSNEDYPELSTTLRCDKKMQDDKFKTVKPKRRWQERPKPENRKAESSEVVEDILEALRGKANEIEGLIGEGPVQAQGGIEKGLFIFQKTETYDKDKNDNMKIFSLPWREQENGYVKVRSVMDSGADESVAPPTMAPGAAIRASPGSLRNQKYTCAGN